ncbi:MAG TPA: ATP-binding protein [Actinomycetota bacterium]|nr:ATP-binding protein [Actinomycetota bacterium]
MSGDLTVTVPARPEYVQVLRSVVAGMAARLDFPYDAIEDLKIAVDEACAQLLPLRPGSLSMRVADGRGEIEATVSADVRAAKWPPDEAERSMAWQVLRALTDEARWERSGDGPALHLVKRIGAPA